jgi:RNA polymerase sigma-70 factor (ECF subfamily)
MDGGAVGELYQRHAAAIEAHCCQVLGHPADAPDAVHETFLRMLDRARPTCSDEHTVRSLFRISTNVCIDVLRQRKVRRRAADTLLVNARSAGAHDRVVDARESVERVLSRCDATTRSIVTLRFIDGMPRGEIAETLGTTRRTVFNRLKRLERLANEVTAEG